MSDVIELTSGTSRPEDEERVVLFKLDGEEYTIPRKPKTNVALRYLKMARTGNADAAAGWLLEELLGEEGFEALMNFDDLTQEQLRSVMTLAAEVTMGDRQVPKG